MKAPILRKKAKAIAVCGKLLRKGKPIVVSKSLIGDAARFFESQGMIRIRPVGKNKVQILMA